MDGLSVSVVPKEQAGMAAGIFNTSKVANEGVALAIVSATLGILTERSIGGIGSLSTEDQKLLPEIAQRLIAGDLTHATHLVPNVSKVVLVQSYFSAFQGLSIGLALMTATAAAIIFCLLRSAIIK
jgi:hypothetical protein